MMDTKSKPQDTHTDTKKKSKLLSRSRKMPQNNTRTATTDGHQNNRHRVTTQGHGHQPPRILTRTRKTATTLTPIPRPSESYTRRGKHDSKGP
ncbi:hypothetical protein Pmani_039495 [Petrolisthes manimaculis]|uniref:Uncharacterized protein n=1 Tax=Petrolisthes manimaculis TaxID=1843537 RepID=A0AAE1TLA6_9EUCA|nr:hypothetical protein Pmani_039495 [Petrolisthes manimaculis]